MKANTLGSSQRSLKILKTYPQFPQTFPSENKKP